MWNKVPKREYQNGKGYAQKQNPNKIIDKGVIYSSEGQWKYPGQVTKIPGTAYGTQITMDNVPYPVYGEDDLGYVQMMYPGIDYTFPGQYVTEIPMAQNGKQVENRTLWGVGSQFIPGYEAYLDWKNIASGIKTGNKSDMYTGIIGLAAPFSGKALGNTLDYATEKTLGKKTADYNQKKREDIVNMSQHDREKLFLKYGHGGYDAWAKDGFPELAYGGDPSIENLNQMKKGGWLKGYNPKTKLRGDRGKTSKNIKTSINEIMLRNETLFGPRGRKIYDPTSKFQEGGWLNKYT